jgi:hypothetical protein
LRDHWGAVAHDLVAAGHTWDDIGSARLPVPEFVSFVLHRPPGSAVYHERNEGWTVNDHLQAQAIDALNYLAWAKTTDAQRKNPRHKPEPIARPGMTPKPQLLSQQPAQNRLMTVSEYAAKTGIAMNWEE